jgi:hypothetical protein
MSPPGRGGATTSVISTVTNRGQMRVIIRDGALNAAIFLQGPPRQAGRGLDAARS